MQNCYVCRKEVKKNDATLELYKSGDATGLLIHRKCVDPEKYGICRYCGPSIVHPDRDLNRQSECEEHAGESSADQEEQEGLEDIIENLTKDG